MALTMVMAACASVTESHVSQDLDLGEPRPNRSGEAQAFVGMGFTDSPDTFLIPAEVDFYVEDNLAIGPRVQLGVADDDTIIAPSFHVKKLFSIPHGDGSSRWKPYAQAGAGLAWLERERRGVEDDEVGGLIHVGGGVEVFIDEAFSLSAGMDVNVLLGSPVDEDVFVSFRLVEAGFRF